MSVMSFAEFALWAVLGILFWVKKLHRRFPAMGAYLGLRVASTPILLALLYVVSQPWGSDYYPIYFLPIWTVYIASAVLLFFVCMEVFRSALAAFTGLMKFGVVIFRWAALASVIVAISSISFAHRGLMLIPDIAYALMRTVSILELCLLAFLCLSMNALRLPVRDLSFGIALGFGLMSSNDFVFSLLVTRNASLTAPLQFVYESMILATLCVWTAYCAVPEPARQPVVMPASSTIYRWNEIASALGHTGTQIAVPQQANGFFLTDVESVVDKVLNRNLKKRESEL
jgi:hypothetical protein